MKRFSGHATKINDPILGGVFFFDTPPSHSSADVNSTEKCHDFRSGDVRRKQADYCDVSGVFGAICNHGLIFGLMNISKGESLSYSLQMIEEIQIAKPISRHVIGYDIICRLRNNPRFKADCGFIPEMHSYNHNESCQSKFSPNRMLGIGAEDGEDMERGWSYFGAASAHTSVMRNENRIDALTIIAEAYNENRFFNLVKRLKNDLLKCKSKLIDINDRIILHGIKDYSEVSSLLQKANQEFSIRNNNIGSDSKSQFLKSVKHFVRQIRILKNRSMKKGKSFNLFMIMFTNSNIFSL